MTFSLSQFVVREEVDAAIGTAISKLSFLHIKYPQTRAAAPKDLPEVQKIRVLV